MLILFYASAAWALTWTEKVIYAHAASESVESIAIGAAFESFWITYEVVGSGGLHRLFVVSYVPATGVLGTPILVASNTLNTKMSPSIATDGNGDIHLLYTDSVMIDDPATVPVEGCSQPALPSGPTTEPGRLMHALVDPTPAVPTVTIDTVVNSVVCTNYGKKSTYFDSADSQLHACWTAKRFTSNDDEVRCSDLALPGTTWTSIEQVTGPWNDDGFSEDHAAVHADAVTGEVRRIWHTDASGSDVVNLETFRPSGVPLSFNMVFSKATSRIDNPTVITRFNGGGFALAFGEDGNKVMFADCPAGDALTCSSGSAWTQWNGTAVVPEQVVGGTLNRFADLTAGAQAKPRYWVNWENDGTEQVGVAYKCNSASVWTIEDPSAGTDPEVNDRRGTPHIARHVRFAVPSSTDDIGIVFRRETATGKHDAILVWANDGSLAACP